MTPASAEVLHRLTVGTHARIDLSAYQSNIGVLRGVAGPDKSFMAVVKADAYGHGATQCAMAAVDAGVDWLGVARVIEAVILRQQGVTAPILVLGPPGPAEIELAFTHDITLTVGSWLAFQSVSEAVQREGREIRVHLKVDTGMHRYGLHPDEAVACATRIAEDERLILEGIFTHFACADEIDPAPTDAQAERFRTVVERLREQGIQPRFIHQANSAAVLSSRSGASNMVRCGIATYGLSPSADVPVPSRVRPVMSIRSMVARRFRIEAREGVSYGLTWRAEHDADLVDVPIGYADGLSRHLSNQGWFVIRGEQCRIRGRVCMDQTVAHAPGACREGDDVVVVGDRSLGAMTLDDVAGMSGTINYEIATRLTARVPRIYVRDGRPVAWEHLLAGTSGTFV